MRSKPWKPLRVEIDLGGLVVVPDRHPVMLDGLLLSLLGERLALPFVQEALPLQAVESTDWGSDPHAWLASAFVIDWEGPSTDRFLHRNARPHELLDDAADHVATSVDPTRGITKVARTRLAVRQAAGARAWCLGHAEPVSELLGRLQAFGSHRHIGYGQVRGFRVVEDQEALVRAWQRPLPGDHALDPFRGARYRAPGRATPPYWDRDLSRAAWWPTAQLQQEST